MTPNPMMPRSTVAPAILVALADVDPHQGALAREAVHSSPASNGDHLPGRDKAEERGGDRQPHAEGQVDGGPRPLAVLDQRDGLVAEGGEGGVSAAEADGEQGPDLGCQARGVDRVAQDRGRAGTSR